VDISLATRVYNATTPLGGRAVVISGGRWRWNLSKRTHNTKATAVTQFDPSIRGYKRNGTVLAGRSATNSVNICNAPRAPPTQCLFTSLAPRTLQASVDLLSGVRHARSRAPTDARRRLVGACLIDRRTRATTPAGGARAWHCVQPAWHWKSRPGACRVAVMLTRVLFTYVPVPFSWPAHCHQRRVVVCPFDLLC